MIKSEAGRVFLLGAGPGDPELITLKALRLIQSSDVVVYDRLVSPEILDLIPARVERIDVGKMPNRHKVPQEQINRILLQQARSGARVVRLKGGDPNVFGRGAEEAEYLERHGVVVEMVPGVTAAAGCSASARVPLTFRGLASGVRFVTGHRKDNGDLDLNWDSLADPDTTLVVYMGVASLGVFRDKLIESGLPKDTPAVMIANGTTPRERVVRAQLGNLPERAAEVKLEPPVMTVIGRVAGLACIRETLEEIDDLVPEAANG